MKVYAFDVDETLTVSGGPITTEMVFNLRNEGNITGMCGNWAMMTGNNPNWYLTFSFIGPLSMTKADFLSHIHQYIPADEYVMVGNDPRFKGQSQDAEAARLANWRFIREDDFAAGAR